MSTQKDGYKEMTCNVPTCVHKTSVRESMCSLVPVIVCKVGNLAEMNFTTGAGKADIYDEVDVFQYPSSFLLIANLSNLAVS